jgi:hypothetical protein
VAVEARGLPEKEEVWAEAGGSAPEAIVFVPIVGKSSPMKGKSLVLSTSAQNAAPRCPGHRLRRYVQGFPLYKGRVRG